MSGGTMPQWAKDTMDEVARARDKFPGNKLCVTAFTEEHGEAVRAVLEHYYAPSPERLAEVRKELIQTIAMAVRLLEEGDPIHELPASMKPVPVLEVGMRCWFRNDSEQPWQGPGTLHEIDDHAPRYGTNSPNVSGHWHEEAKPFVKGVDP